MIFKLIHSIIHKLYKLSIKALLLSNKEKYTKAFILNKLVNLNIESLDNLDYKIPITFEKNKPMVFNLNGIKIINSNLHRRHLKNFNSTFHNEAKKILKYFKDDAEKTIIDLGANEGEISIFFAKKSRCKVFAVECAKKNIEILNKNISLNEVKNIKVLRYAVSDKDDIKLAVDFKSNQTGVYDQNYLKNTKEGNEIVESITLSTLLKEQNINFVDLIKIDIENSNYLVADCILKNSDKIKTIMWELGYQDAEKYKKTILELDKKFKFYIDKNNDYTELNLNDVLKKIEEDVRVDTDGFDILLFNKKFDEGKGINI